MLVHEFRTEWPTQSLLSNDDVEFIRMAIDTALAMAEREGHTSNTYDLNPTTWSIWLVQHTFATRSGRWTVESLRQQQTLSFEGLYLWLEDQHARNEPRNIYDPGTKELLHRYKLPFKAHMVIPPPKNELYKWRKGAKRVRLNTPFDPHSTCITHMQHPVTTVVRLDGRGWARTYRLWYN